MLDKITSENKLSDKEKITVEEATKILNEYLNTHIGHIFEYGKKDLKETLTDIGISDIFETELNNLSPDFTIEKFTPNRPHNRGKIDVRKNRIFINEKITSTDDFIKVVAHEIQHGIDEAEKLRIIKKLANFEKLTDNEKKLLDDINKTKRATINKNEFYKNHKEIVDKIDNIYQNSKTLDELDYNFRINKISKNDIKTYEQYSKLVKKYANSPREKACNKFGNEKVQEYHNKKGGNNGSNKNTTRNTRILGNDERNSYTAIHEPIYTRATSSESRQGIQRTTEKEQTGLNDSEYFDDDGYISNSDIKSHIPDDIDEILPKVKPPKDNTVEKIITPISTRLDEINPTLKHAIRKFEFESGITENRYASTISPFIRKLDYMTPSDYAKYDLALKNGNKEVISSLNTKYDLSKEYTAIKNLLEKIRNEAVRYGLDVGYIEDYFPRKVINPSAILEEYSKSSYIKNLLREIDPKNISFFCK